MPVKVTLLSIAVKCGFGGNRNLLSLLKILEYRSKS